MDGWTPTMELRRYDDTEKLTGPRLQQRWVRRAGLRKIEHEWRDVPLVWEPNGRRQAVTAADRGKSDG